MMELLLFVKNCMVVSASGLARVKHTLKEKLFFGQEPSVELLAILAVYFVQGILGLARLAVSFFLKDELHLGPAEVSALMGVVSIPWMVKPIWAIAVGPT
jgi:BT1 family